MYKILSRESLCAENQTLNGQLVLLVNHLGNKKAYYMCNGNVKNENVVFRG